MTFHVYVCHSKKHSLTKVGVTSNLDRRLAELNSYDLVDSFTVASKQEAYNIEKVTHLLLSPHSTDRNEYYSCQPQKALDALYSLTSLPSYNFSYTEDESDVAITKVRLTTSSTGIEDLNESLCDSVSIRDLETGLLITKYRGSDILCHYYVLLPFCFRLDPSLSTSPSFGDWGLPYSELECLVGVMEKDLGVKYRVSNCQWAFYLRSNNKDADLYVLRHIYTRLSIESGKYLCNYLGLEHRMDPDMSDYSILLQKRIGNGKWKKNVFSVGIYDKLAQMRASGKAQYLNHEQEDFLSGVLRVDITFHKPQLESMIKQAKKIVKHFSKTHGFEFPNLKRFMDSEATTAYMIARAMSILTWRYNKETETIERGRFSEYLIQYVLCDKMCLDSLLSGVETHLQRDTLDGLNDTEFAMFKMWKSYQGSNFIQDFSSELNVSLKTAYAAKNALRDNNITVDVPYQLMLELGSLDCVYGLNRKELESLSDTTLDANVRLGLMDVGAKRIQNNRKDMLLGISSAFGVTAYSTLHLEA